MLVVDGDSKSSQSLRQKLEELSYEGTLRLMALTDGIGILE